MRIIMRHLCLIAILISLTACHTTNTLLPENGPSMETVYDSLGHSKNNLALIRKKIQAQSKNIQAKKSSAFYKLPNPDLTLYVFPHFSGQEQLPVPGYNTVISAYEHDYYGLASERNENH